MAGLEVDLCRAIAAVLGDGAKVEFHPYALGQDFERLRRGRGLLPAAGPDHELI